MGPPEKAQHSDRQNLWAHGNSDIVCAKFHNNLLANGTGHRLCVMLSLGQESVVLALAGDTLTVAGLCKELGL